jgi:TonB family protein
MLVWATRTVSTLALRAAFYAGLFLVVALVHVAITSALRSSGWSAGLSLFVSGGVVLALVLVLVNLADYVRERRAASREITRMKQNLPVGPCCVVWREGDGGGGGDMPWDIVGDLHARYPKLARRLGVEGFAVVDFEINAEGAAKNVHCIDAWPSDVFYEAAREALSHARFTPKPETHPRFGASYRLPFVFRIAGAARLRERGHRARQLRPALKAAAEAVEKLRRSA